MFLIKENVSTIEKDGQILSIELILENEGKDFSLQIGTPLYVSMLEEARERTQAGFDKNEVLVLSDVDLEDRDKILGALNSLPIKNLFPFLVLQEK